MSKILEQDVPPDVVGWMRRRCRHAVQVACFALAISHVPGASADYEPAVAIVMCPDTYEVDWYGAHSSSQGLVGLANLIGVPYRTLTLEQLLAEGGASYTSLWFSNCLYVSEERIGPLVALLDTHIATGKSVFLDGPLGTAYRDTSEQESYRSMAETMPCLGVTDAGWHDLTASMVRTTSVGHAIATSAGYGVGAQLTQGILAGTETFEPINVNAPGSAVLLELVPPGSGPRHPFLVVAEPAAGARVLAIGAYGNYIGPATPFRNQPPAGFYDNRLLPYLIHAILWTLAPGNEPFAGLQLSHAPMTVAGRLDGDWSNSPLATELTLDYLIELARNTGVATVYGIVSSYAQQTGWEGFRPRIEQLQRLGGSVASHSHTHPDDMSATMSAAEWNTEIAGSLQAIRDALTDPTFVPEAIAFINPGNTIQSRDYGRFFDSVELYMTHGFETEVPYSSGVMGFGLPAGVPPRAVINNTPVPDFQWLYLKDWSYTVASAASLQAQILDFYQNRIGRGVLYNQMWHDYALSDQSPPLHFPGPTRPLFDANRDHFATRRIYAPSVRELVAKMHHVQGANLSSRWLNGALEVTIAYQTPPSGGVYQAGMGLRVHRPPGTISSVTINGQPHHAFTADTVILPAFAGPQEIVVRFGGSSATRLVHISKRFDQITLENEQLEVRLSERGLDTRFCVAGVASTVLLGADGFVRTDETELCGYLLYGSTTSMVAARELDTGSLGLRFNAADRPLTAVGFDGAVATIEVGPGDAGELRLASAVAPALVTVAGNAIEIEITNGAFVVPLPMAAESIMVAIYISPVDVPAGGSSELHLVHAYPNPTRRSVAIDLVSPGKVPIALEVFDIAGRRLRKHEAGALPAGHHRWIWDGRGDDGQPVPGGVYLIAMWGGGSFATRRVVILGQHR